MQKTYLAFDDVFLFPQFSDCFSRSEIDTSTSIGRFKIRSPMMSANMDTITESLMAISMWNAGAIGSLHRFMPVEKNVSEYRRIRDANCDAFVSVGVKEDDILRAKALYDAGATHFIVDIAHGHSGLMRQMLKQMRNTFGSTVYIVAGNIATPQAVKDLAYWGADCVKIGIGGGSRCKTRVVTGHGVPMFSCLLEWCEEADGHNVQVIADGGIKCSGDIVKSIVAGADMVMLGSLLAGTPETPGEIIKTTDGDFKIFRGMASNDAMESRYNGMKTNLPADEGVSGSVRAKSAVRNQVENLTKGLQSGMSYSGASTLESLRATASWEIQTHNGNIEGIPRL